MIKSYQKRKKKLNQIQNSTFIKEAFLSNQFRHDALFLKEPGTGNDKSETIIVSLTTFRPRINSVYLTIESLLQQSLKPDRIQLWLSKDEFSPEDIPEILKRQQERGLEICYCPENLGPYKKFYYSMTQNPGSIIITVDDDTIYPINTIDLLYREHIKNPQTIICHRAHKIKFNKRGQILPYKQWDRATNDDTTSLLITPTGVGGVLYFPGCLSNDAFDKDVFLKICPDADDIWLKAMSLKKGTPCKKTNDLSPFNIHFLTIPGSQQHALKRKNKSKQNGNDNKIKAVFDRYNIWERITP